LADNDTAQQEFWEERAEAWERRADALDAFSDTYGLPAIDALAPQPGERLLDIGCGPGTTAVELARRVGPDGEVVAVDVAAGMIAALGRRLERAGIANVRGVVADAGRDPLGDGFDGAFSRFGVMFFADPVAAFANIGRALRPGGRFACVVWGPLAENPWMFVPTLAAVQVLEAQLEIPGPGEPGPFSLAEPDRVTEVLRAGGFADIGVEPIAGARMVTPDVVDNDLSTLLEVGPLGPAFTAADDRTRQAAIDAVIAAVEPYRDGDGWRLPGAALVVTATRPPA
jgi:SAM-dependent methyltransferase